MGRRVVLEGGGREVGFPGVVFGGSCALESKGVEEAEDEGLDDDDEQVFDPCGHALHPRLAGDSMEPDLHDHNGVAVVEELPATGDTVIACLRDDGLVIKRWY